MTENLSTKQKLIIMLAVMSGLFLVALDQTIVSTSLGKIVEELNSFSSLAWVVTAYLLGNTVTVPLAGKFSDILGRKKVLLTGVAIFSLASLFSGSAGSINQLILMRAIQGIGGGIIMANAFTIVGDLFSPRERGRWQGLIGSVFAIASVVGPLLGGFLTDAHTLFGIATSWRWNFLLNVPIGVFAFTLIAYYCPPLHYKNKVVLDYAGATTLMIALSSLILAVDNTEHIFGALIATGVSLTAIKTALFAVAICMGGVFLWCERRAESPIIPLTFFHNRNFSTVMVVATLFGAAFLSAIIYLTQFNQQVYGVGATVAGLMLVPMVGTLTITSTLSGRLVSKTGHYKKYFMIGLVLTTMGMALLTMISYETPYVVEAIIIAFIGFGLGTGMPIMNVAVQNEFERHQLGVVTASVQLFRGLGSTIGVAALGALLTAGALTQFNSISDSPYLQMVGVHAVGGTTEFVDTILHINSAGEKIKAQEVFVQSLANVPETQRQQEIARFREVQTQFSKDVAIAFAHSFHRLFFVSTILMALAVGASVNLREKHLADWKEVPTAAG